MALMVLGYLYVGERDHARQLAGELLVQRQKVEEHERSISSLYRAADGLCNTLWGLWRRQGEPSPSRLERGMINARLRRGRREKGESGGFAYGSPPVRSPR